MKWISEWFSRRRQPTQNEVVLGAIAKPPPDPRRILNERSLSIVSGEIPALRSDWRAEKPWNRGTFAEDMEPLAGARQWNNHGTFCRYCGDWIVDSAYYSEHSGQHRPRRGSWNWLHPETKRRDPEDLKPNHEEWLEETRDFYDRYTQSECSFSGTGPAIDPHRDRAFHSEEEARQILEPFGCRVYWCPQSGWSVDGGPPSGSWTVSGSRRERLKYETRAQTLALS